jgi:hypothetical protein
MLERAEYVEQAYFFRSLAERMKQEMPTQDLLSSLRQEILASTKLPLAIDFLASELRLQGVMGPAMLRLAHYFTPFQAFVIAEAEEDRSRLDFTVAMQVLEREAEYRAQGATPQGIFLFQFETLCRNRLGYQKGLSAMAADPIFDAPWREFVASLRAQVGTIDLGDLIYLRSEHYVNTQARREVRDERMPPVLFGEKEGQIALANRRKDPLLLFAALQRHLNYPLVPKPRKADESAAVVPMLARRMERLEMRVKLLEDEQRGGIDITKYYQPPPPPPSDLKDELGE